MYEFYETTMSNASGFAGHMWKGYGLVSRPAWSIKHGEKVGDFPAVAAKLKELGIQPGDERIAFWWRHGDVLRRSGYQIVRGNEILAIV